MKKLIIMFAVGLLIQRIAHAQGTMTYLSNLGYTSTGSSSVGSDAWFAADFITGTNAGGYLLDSIELGMADATGNSSGFTVMIYDKSVKPAGELPGSSLGTLSGSLNPITAGIYTYTPASSLMLSPNTYYFIVLTAGTLIANGGYEWSVTSTPSPGYTSYHWGGEVLFAHSSNGLNWNYSSGTYGQYALTATAIPEPSALGLLGLGGLGFLWRRRRL